MAYSEIRKTAEPAANELGEATAARLGHRLATWPRDTRFIVTVIHR